MEPKLLQKLDRLKKAFQEGDDSSQWTIGEWEEQAKTALLKDNLLEHDGVKMIVSHITQEVADINEVLISTSSKDLPDTDRDRLLDIKKFYSWFLTFFSEAKEDIKRIEKNVDNNLEEEE